MRHRHNIIVIAACILLVTQLGCGEGDSAAVNTADGKLEGGSCSLGQNTPTASITSGFTGLVLR